jgi:SIR2-like protein
LAKTPSSRNQLLVSYFEPTEKEREDGLKLPTQAHKSIANLVKEGYIKIILTTNFDRLIENALQDIGITPIVVSSTDAIKGIMPLQHTNNLIIKLHGDYKDTRIRNSENELENYEEELDSLLDRVFDEYGLIICGWSAEWDKALIDALTRCKNHRFQTYWTYRGEFGEYASKLIELRKAEKIEITDSDSFFKDIEEKVMAIEKFNEPHPLSAKTTVATLKTLLRDERQDINLHDMVMNLTDSTYTNLSINNFPLHTKENPFNADNFIERVRNYESYIDTLLNMIIAGCYWGDEKNSGLWVKSIQKISNPQREEKVNNNWLNLSYYTSQLLFYGAGLSSLFSNNYETLASLYNNINVRTGTEEIKLFYFIENTKYQPMGNDNAKILTKNDSLVAVSEYLCSHLRKYFRDYFTSDIDYQKSFDEFEYLHSLIVADEWSKKGAEQGLKESEFWGPVGLFAVRDYYEEEGQPQVKANISSRISQEQYNLGIGWPPLKVGFFEGSIDRFKTIKAGYDAGVHKHNPSISVVL